MAGLFDALDQMIANYLEVDVDTFINTIDEFNDEDMEFIIHTIMDGESTEEEREKAKDLFKTKLKL